MRKKSKAGSKRTPKQAGSRGAVGKKKKTSAGAGAGATRSVDRRALRRILTWLLEANTEQQSLILSAMDIVSDSRESSGNPAERSTSPGALLRAILAERTAAVLHPPPASDK